MQASPSPVRSTCLAGPGDVGSSEAEDRTPPCTTGFSMLGLTARRGHRIVRQRMPVAAGHTARPEDRRGRILPNANKKQTDPWTGLFFCGLPVAFADESGPLRAGSAHVRRSPAHLHAERCVSASVQRLELLLQFGEAARVGPGVGLFRIGDAAGVGCVDHA